jgi:hypothetical protein
VHPSGLLLLTALLQVREVSVDYIKYTCCNEASPACKHRVQRAAEAVLHSSSSGQLTPQLRRAPVFYSLVQTISYKSELRLLS